MVKYFFSLICFLTFSLPVMAEEFIAGKDYVVLSHDNHHSPQKKIIISEFFSYGCPWCYRLETPLQNWLIRHKGQVLLEKVPVIFHKDWEIYAKAYYTVQAFDLNAKYDPILFKAILEEKRSLNNKQAMVDFLAGEGMDKETLESAFSESRDIELKLIQGQRLMGQYQINAVPALVVNQQYKTDLQMAKTESRLFAILDFLVKKYSANPKA